MARKIGSGLSNSRPRNVKNYVKDVVFGSLKGILKDRPLVEVQMEYVW